MAQTRPKSLPLLVEEAGSPKAEICKFSQSYKIELRLRHPCWSETHK